MALQIVNGWLKNGTRTASPNADERPDVADISLLVIHNISLPPGQFGGPHIGKFFCNQLNQEEHPYFAEICHLEVSAHLLIDRHGNVTQFVPFHRRAWHAGVSNFQGRERCNDFSIGIELEGADDIPYTGEQYRQLTDITCAICAEYPMITPERIVGHSDIAPGRKTDPGSTFDWSFYHQLLERLLK